jgi:glycosyltransferase involved in cell wall biosynthesis
LRICHVNLARGFRGGERQTAILIRELASRGVSQRLVARRGEALAAHVGAAGTAEVRPVGSFAPTAAAAFGGMDIVHVHEARGGQPAWLGRRFGGPPYVLTRRVVLTPSDSPLTRRIYRDAAARVALSSAIAETMRAWDPGLDWTVIPSAVAGLPHDPEHARELSRRWDGDFVIGHVGALDDATKGQADLIDAFRRLAADGAPRLVLVGSGPDEARLRAAAADLPVVFAGQIEDVGSHLAALDAFAFPSRHEGLGSTLLDAMSFGLPVVATRVGGIPDIVEDGVNGLLVPAGDPPALAEALGRLRRDPGLRERLSAASRATAARYGAAQMAERYLALYRSVSDRRQCGPDDRPGRERRT